MTEPDATSHAAPQPPVADARYGRRRLLLAVAVGLGAIAIVAFGILSYRSFDRRLESARKLDRATALVEDADAIVVRVDEIVRAEVTPDIVERARGAADRVRPAEKMLAEAIDLAEEAQPDLTDDDQERAELLIESASARLEMLEPAPTILEANAQAASALPLANEGWDDVVEADKLADQAVASYNKLNRAGVSASSKLNKEAAGLLTGARDRLDSAENAFPAAPFELYLAYIDARIALNRLSQQSDREWLAGEIGKANAVIARYNVDDKKAVALAKKLPPSPDEAVADAFTSSTEQATDAYYAARERALKADQAIRDY
jgi:hypothetical protein